MCAPGDSDFPVGKSETDGSRNEEEKLFFLQKVFLFAIFPRKIANSLFKNAPYGMGIPLSAESGRGLCPLDTHDFLKKIE